MPREDHAIVVGIANYPTLNPPPKTSADLRSPNGDADAVAKWLDKSGSFEPENIRVIHGGLANGSGPLVDQNAIRREFRRLDDIAEVNRKNGIHKVGRRLYFYFSGHGFSPKRHQGALYTSDATSRDPLHCYVSAWLEWFQDAAYFDEYVLWMDCCMDRIFTVVPEPVFLPRGGVNATGRVFVGMAAQRTLKTVERAIKEDNDQVHGVFTWTLLKGLRGEARDPATGQVNGSSLRRYLINTMKVLLSPEDLANPQIANEPEVPFADDLVFVEQVSLQECSVTLRFGSSLSEKAVKVWSGAALSSQDLATDAQGEATVNLRLGLYVVEMVSAGLRQSFEVVETDALEVEVTEKGPAVALEDARFQLNVSPGDPTAQISLVDHELKLIGQGVGNLSRELPPGLYKIKLRIGSDTREQIVLLDRHVEITAPEVMYGEPQANLGIGQLAMERPRPASAAPMEGNAFTHEYHIHAAQFLRTVPATRPAALFGRAKWPATAEIRLMARVWTGSAGKGIDGEMPWKGVELRREDGVILLKLADLPVEFPENDPYVNARVEVLPGSYFLWQQLDDGRVFEQSLIVPKNWALEVFWLAVPKIGALEPVGVASSGALALSRCSVLMKAMPPADGRMPQDIPNQDRIYESSRAALADERNVMNADLERLLMEKAQNPLAGLLGALLIIAEAERSNDPEAKKRLEHLDVVVPNLRSLLGSHHPDVEAISLKCPDAGLRAKLPIQGVPMFERSWRLLAEGMQNQPDLVPSTLWDRVRAAMSVEGFLVWAADDETRQAHMRGLENWVTETESFSNLVAESFGDSESVGGLEVRRSGLEGRGGFAAAQHTPLSKDPEKDAAITWAGKLGIPASAMADLIEKVQSKKK